MSSNQPFFFASSQISSLVLILGPFKMIKVLDYWPFLDYNKLEKVFTKGTR